MKKIIAGQLDGTMATKDLTVADIFHMPLLYEFMILKLEQVSCKVKYCM